MKHCVCIIIAFTALFSVSIITSSAQDQSSIYLLRDNALFTLDGAGLQSTVADLTSLSLPITDSSNPDYRYITSADISSNGDQLYLLLQEGRLSAKLPFPKQTRIIAVDTRSKTLRVLYERPGIFAFVLSPDEQHMIVGYYEADYYFSPRQSCILVLQTGLCAPMSHQISADPGNWIDNMSYIVPTQGDDLLHVINVETGTDRALPLPKGWSLNAASPIPGTRSILIGAGRLDLSQSPLFGFFVLNIDTLEVKMLPYGEANTISWWRFSPDNQYMLYGGDRPKLVEFSTGRLIRQFTSVVHEGWIGDHTLVIQGRVDANSEVEIASIDAATGDVRQLAVGKAASGILLIPKSST